MNYIYFLIMEFILLLLWPNISLSFDQPIIVLLLIELKSNHSYNFLFTPGQDERDVTDQNTVHGNLLDFNVWEISCNWLKYYRYFTIELWNYMNNSITILPDKAPYKSGTWKICCLLIVTERPRVFLFRED